MLLSKNIIDFLDRNFSKLSQWFEAEHVIIDCDFVSTQPAETNILYSISFCESAKYVQAIKHNPCINCVITTEDLSHNFEDKLGIVIAENPRVDFFTLHNKLAKSCLAGIVFAPSVAKTAQIHPTASIDEYCYIGDEVQIGAGARILRNSYLAEGTIIGPNVVIGADGLEFKRTAEEKLLKVIHAGGVYLGPGVEVMANSVICRDVYFGYTEVGAETKIGPLCNIGHRTKIGRTCLIAGNTTLSGSVKIGNSVRIGPSATIVDGVSIGDGAQVTLGATVVRDVGSKKRVSGFFAVDHIKALKEYSSISGKS